MEFVKEIIRQQIVPECVAAKNQDVVAFIYIPNFGPNYGQLAHSMASESDMTMRAEPSMTVIEHPCIVYLSEAIEPMVLRYPSIVPLIGAKFGYVEL